MSNDSHRNPSTQTVGVNSEAASSPHGVQDDIARFLQRHGVQPQADEHHHQQQQQPGNGNNNGGTQQQSATIQSPDRPTGDAASRAKAAASSSSSTPSTTQNQRPTSSSSSSASASSPLAAGNNNQRQQQAAGNTSNNNNNNTNSRPGSAASPTAATAAGAAAAGGGASASSSPSMAAAAGAGANSSPSSSPSGGGALAHTEYIAWSDVYDNASVPIEGNAADIWNIDDYADEHDATAFDYPAYEFGAGISRNQHMTLLQSIGFDLSRVPFTSCRPYLKEAPPTGLPLESFDLRIIYDAGRTGFEDNKEFPITPGTIIAGRYKITEYIGSAAFSRAVQAIDLKHNAYVCVKIVRNSKDFFDQALDEIKLLHYINCNGDPDENHVVQLYDFFYFKEHVFLVCELLRDNLYEFGKYNREHEDEAYFTLPRLQSITRQILRALAYVHTLNLLHCDLKPENVLIKSYSRCEVKVIDFGSSCFTTDNLSSYIQSRCYRAPEVVLGCKYDGRIDVWSLGAMLPELATGHVLFHNDTLPQMLNRISALVGPFPSRMIREGRHSCRYVTKTGLFYELIQPGEAGNETGTDDKLVFYYPKPRRLEELCGYDDPDYLDFVRRALTVDHTRRPSALELLEHPFITKTYPEGGAAAGAGGAAAAGASPVTASSPAAAAATPGGGDGGSHHTVTSPESGAQTSPTGHGHRLPVHPDRDQPQARTAQPPSAGSPTTPQAGSQ